MRAQYISLFEVDRAARYSNPASEPRNNALDLMKFLEEEMVRLLAPLTEEKAMLHVEIFKNTKSFLNTRTNSLIIGAKD